MSYITKDDYLEFSGIDLELEFKNGNYDISDPVPIFIKRVEEIAISILKNWFDTYKFEEKINNNLEAFKRGMLWQINYILQNSELYLNNEQTPVNNERKFISATSYNIWRNIGLCNPVTRR